MIDLFSTIAQFGARPLLDDSVVVREPPKPAFYVHFEKKSLQIFSVSGSNVCKEEHLAIEIDYDLALSFMEGTQSILAYEIVALRNESYELIKKTNLRQVIDRVDVVQRIYEVTEQKEHDTYIEFKVCADDILEVSYHGDLVEKESKFYLTRYNDPAFLKCTFSLDVNTLNQIAQDNHLDEWPNPIRLKIDKIHDLSIFGIRGQTKATIQQCQSISSTNSTSSTSATTSRRKKNSGRNSKQ